MHGERPPLALKLVFLGKHVGYLLEHRLASRGLNRTQTIIMTALSRHPGLQALELCVPAGVEPANVTRTLQSLERLGLLERRPHPTDGRAHLFFLTDAGHSLARELSEEIHAISDALTQELDPEERPQLERLLDSLWRGVGHQLSAASHQHAAAQPEGAPGGNGEGRRRHFMSRTEKLKAED